MTISSVAKETTKHQLLPLNECQYISTWQSMRRFNEQSSGPSSRFPDSLVILDYDHEVPGIGVEWIHNNQAEVVLTDFDAMANGPWV